MDKISGWLRLIGVIVSSLWVAGCAQQSDNLYQWDGYEPQSHEYFKASAKSARLKAL